MQPRSYNIDELRCNAFTKGGKTFDVVRYEDFMRETNGFSFPHRHNYYMILLASGGTGSQLIDFQYYDILAGDMFFMYPGMIHAWEKDEALTGYLLFFTADFFAQRYHYDSLLSFPFFGKSQGQPVVSLAPTEQKNIAGLFELMLQEYQLGGKKMVNAIRSLVNVALIQAARSYQRQYKSKVDTKQRVLIHQFEELVDQHYVTKRLVKEYAAQLHITPNYLNILCKTIRGKAAGELIRERVMLEARRKLIHEDKNVTEIAYDLNFKDNAYFGRFFKKNEGISPEQFRQQMLYQQQ